MMSFENYDPSFPDQPVVDLYLKTWSKLPSFLSKPAFIWAQDHHQPSSTTSTLTYGELNQSVQTISSNLLLPLRRGDTLLILCPPGLDLVKVIFGCQRAGMLAVPITPPDISLTKNDGYHHLVRAISQTKPKAAIATRDYIKRVQGLVSMVAASSSLIKSKQLSHWLQKVEWIASEDIVGDNGMQLQKSGASSSGYKGCKAEEAYLVQYTSGGTGIPKPVLVTAGAAAHNVRTARKAYDLHPNSVIVSWLPQYHDAGLMFLLLTIVSGATCVLTSPSTFIRRPRIWLELITHYKATCTPVPSFTLPLVLKRGGNGHGINLASMKNLIIINEPIYSSDVIEFVRVFNTFGLDPSAISPSYGLAEVCTFVSTAWRSERKGELPVYKKLLPSARLCSVDEYQEEEIKILVVNEETHDPVEDGIEGEIWISSPSNASGYLGHPNLTREVFDATLSSWAKGKFVRTGDMGVVMGEERYLYVTGRNSDIVKLPDGKELQPHYIETTAYQSYPQILRGGCLAAFVISHQTVTIVAEMQKMESEISTLRSICEGIRKRVLEEEGVRVGVVVLVKGGNVPKTTSGKIQRWLAKDKLMSGKMDILMYVEFESDDSDLGVWKMISNGYKGKDGSMIRSKVINEDTKETVLVPLYSSL